jgi:hypothetical protein
MRKKHVLSTETPKYKNYEKTTQALSLLSTGDEVETEHSVEKYCTLCTVYTYTMHHTHINR